MQIDIRKEVGIKVTEIVFADTTDTGDAYKLELDDDLTKIVSEDDRVYINSKEDALNLIRALEKAIELGTWS